MDSLDIDIGKAELSDVLAPWVIRQWPTDAAEWREIRAKVTRKARRDRFRRAVRSAVIPWSNTRKDYRTPDFVHDTYSDDWTRYKLPSPADAADEIKKVYLDWHDTAYEAQVFARGRCHLLGLAKVFERLQPSTVLEIGAGPGVNLLALSAVFPGIDFSGIELTGTGVQAAKSVQGSAMPDAIEQIAPMPVKSRTAHQRISFQQGDARDLPFPEASFDLVFSRLALEQMEQIRDQALAEIHRVTKTHAVFIEPLRDYNRDPLRSLMTGMKNYISLSVSDLPAHGFEPVFQFADWPHKITNGAGMIVCRKV